jgi:hypothetical protein
MFFFNMHIDEKNYSLIGVGNPKLLEQGGKISS